MIKYLLKYFIILLRVSNNSMFGFHLESVREDLDFRSENKNTLHLTAQMANFVYFASPEEVNLRNDHIR